MQALKTLMDEFGSNGFILADGGNGCAGPRWVEWSDDVAREYGDTPMYLQAEHGALLGANYKEFLEGDTSVIYASALVVSGEGDNPYRYRIIFCEMEC